MPSLMRFCLDWIAGAAFTLLLSVTVGLVIGLAAIWTGAQPFSIALGPFWQFEYQAGGSTLFAIEIQNHLLLAALGGLLYGAYRSASRLSHVG